MQNEAKRIIREDAKKDAALNKKINAQLIWNGTRYFSDRYCSPQQEYEEDGVVLRGKYNVADRIPRDKNGKLDLVAEYDKRYPMTYRENKENRDNMRQINKSLNEQNDR